MCNALHALPIRRESWLLTHFAAGMLFCIIPVAATGIIFLIALGSFWMAGLLWMGALILQFLFFFSTGLLAMLLTGNRFAGLVVYCILNFFAGIALWLFYALYIPHFHGLIIDPDPWLVFCPVAHFVQHEWFTVLSFGTTSNLRLVVLTGWGYLAICALVALGIVALSMLVYRKRNLEAAGDFLAFRRLNPVFLVLYTFSAGAAMHLFCQLFIEQGLRFAFLLVGLTVGFLTGLMLLRRTLRVFRLRAFAQYAVILGVFGLTLLLTVLDPIGITRWTPKAEDVQSVVLNRMYSSDMTEFRHTDPAIIQQVISVHQHGIQTPNSGSNGEQDITLTIQYTMKSGRKVSRQYAIDTGTLAAITLEYVLSQPEQLFGTAYPTAQALAERASTVTVYNSKGDKETPISEKEDILAILEAIYADARKGDLVQEWPLISDNGRETYSVYVEDFRSPYRRTWYVSVHTQAKQTTALLDALTK
jgi:ABC-2 type transport system permease protein